ncbi:LacI family DNA-binding transcriptional regulator [Shouchella shacheensis]|uniref:LacI family DNA-binding transcriptional regulator n=1 Tax=Shouchella shacheensis TaxID=1649580 RepID=UPI00073FCCF6|nr:LacI family DNA-binding transcriptional regulator [Shouchella shacheensis]
MPITIKDVAKKANVAPSTVSRVIANSTRISSKTKENVRAAMSELGYHPNFNARNLVNQSTNMLGVVIPSASQTAFHNPFFPEVLRGITAKAHEEKYGLYVSTGQTDREIFAEVKEMVQSKRVDGVVLLYSKTDDPLVPFLIQESFPFVVVGRPPEPLLTEVSYVNNDNVKAAKLVTEYLLLLGHQDIGFIGGQKEAFVTLDHKTGYAKALEQAGVPLTEDYLVYYEELIEGGQQAVIELMALEKPPTSLVVADDLMALGVLRMLAEMGISVPGEVSVISFNNVMVSELASPPLTTLDIHIYQLGYKATELLKERIVDPQSPATSAVVGHTLVKRQSCGSRR